MKKYTRKSMPAWAAWSIGLALLAIVFTAGGLSLYINVAVGLTMGLAAAVMFGLGDVVKMVLPIVMNVTGKHPVIRITYWVVAFVSFFCAFLAVADMFGLRFVEDQTAKKIESVSSERLAGLKESLKTSRELLQKEIENGAGRVTDLRNTLQTTVAMMQAESGRKGCGEKCLNLQAEVKRLQLELNTAVEASCGASCKALQVEVSKLEDELKTATTEQKQVTTDEMSGKAFLGQVVFGVAGKDIDVAAAVATVTMQMLMMELFSLMSGFAATMLGMAIANTKRERALRRAKIANAAKAEKKKAEAKAADDERRAAKKLADAEKKKKLTNHRRKVTIKQKAKDEAKILADKEAKKKAAVAKRKATLAKKKADAIAAAAVKPKRKWTEKQTQAYLARTLAKQQAANV